MGNFVLPFAVLWVLLLGAGRGTSAVRVKVQRNINETSFLPQRLVGQVSPLDNGSGSQRRFIARHLSAKSDQGYYGIIATMDVYGLNLTPEQYTAGSIILHDGEVASLNIIQIGWEVAPDVYGDSRAHLGSMWTTDGYKKTSCHNANCAFQPEKGAPIALGGVIETFSQPNGPKQTITIKIFKDCLTQEPCMYLCTISSQFNRH